MDFIFHNRFYDHTYSDDNASAKGRMEAIMNDVLADKKYIIHEPTPIELEWVQLAHDRNHIASVAENKPLYDMALLAAGGAVLASEFAISGRPAFACGRPPGHHAYRNMSWGFCHFNNIAIALLKLEKENKINNAFVLDFDAHTGDGTRDVLKGNKNFYILNPMASNRDDYIIEVERYIQGLPNVDLIAVSAGFDSYEKDFGRKLKTFDFFQIGSILKKFSKKCGHDRRFATLEGGYYLQDLGKNILAFCDGFGK